VISAVVAGEREPRRLQLMMTQAYPRFSTQWATDPQQQLFYLAVRKFGRRYAPDAILGLFTPEEIHDDIDMGSVEFITDAPAQLRGPQRLSERPADPATAMAAADANAGEQVDQATGEIHVPEANAAIRPSSTPQQQPAQPRPAAEKPAMQNGESAKVEQIDANQVTYLRKKLNAAGLAEAAICRRFNVASIELLSAPQFEQIKSELMKNI
jgi:hypothetical protein